MKTTIKQFALSALFYQSQVALAFSDNQLTIWMGGDKAIKEWMSLPLNLKRPVLMWWWKPGKLTESC